MPDPATVLGKVELILDALAEEGGRLGLTALAEASGIPKASVHRISGDLVAWGVVERNGDGFRLGPRLFELGARVPSTRRLRDTALPYLEELLHASGHSIHLAVPSGDGVFYVEKLVVHASLPTPSSAAEQMPIHATATGKVMLAFGKSSTLLDALARPLEAITEKTITDPATLSADLEATIRRGYSIEHGELAVGYSSVAAPIRGHASQLLGAVSVTSTSDDLQVERVVDALCVTAESISRRLGAPDPAGTVHPPDR